MKLIKGLGLLSFLAIFSGSCFEPPEFPVTPQIEFERIEFIDAADPSQFDSLNLYLNFKDGNGDLGFNESAEDISFPFHNADFYQEKNGGLQRLHTITGYVGNDEYDLLDIQDPSQGKLVVFRTRKKPEYSFLPGTFHCSVYEYLGGRLDPTKGSDGRRLLIEKDDRPALDPMVKLVDSIPDANGRTAYYQIRDTLYYTTNPDHYNIEVDFLVKDPSAPGGFKEFDWKKEFCTTFDGRFPVFSDKDSSIDGTLRYSMTSLGFTALFSIKTLKLRVSIKDRERNQSNVIETTEFTLH
jgi:hypothetical protein